MVGTKPDTAHKQLVRTQVDKQGRIVIPAELREELDLRPAEQVLLRVIDGALQIENRLRSIGRTRGMARRLLGDTGDRSLVDEFIAEKRAEAARE
jgi:AbrB family looped-hinge helix DNA binding protein